MTQQVNMKQKEPGMIEGMIPGLIGMAGTAIGSYYGGPAGGAAGGAIGGQVGKAAAGGKQAQGVESSTPVDREMARIQSDPATQLQQGKQALAGMDEQDKVMLQPVLDEALKRAWQDKRNQSMVG